MEWQLRKVIIPATAESMAPLLRRLHSRFVIHGLPALLVGRSRNGC
jgi:hypothetical protein